MKNFLQIVVTAATVADNMRLQCCGAAVQHWKPQALLQMLLLLLPASVASIAASDVT